MNRALRIAVPKGRLQSKVIETFANAGFDVPTSEELQSRRLVFPKRELEWIFVKDGDVPVYVEHGAADLGVAGLDQILERDCRAYQQVEFPFGTCRMMLIGAERSNGIERAAGGKIATKYPRITAQYLATNRLRMEIVPLSGSVELAAVLDLAPYIVDLVETGETVRIHNLKLLETIVEVTPRMLVARDTYRVRSEEVRELVARVEGALEKSEGRKQKAEVTLCPRFCFLPSAFCLE
jgi:ATP phosphoribosyltransferase